MISERQAEYLLMECEKSIGYPVKGLRQRLARHNKPYSNLWELITLYCTLPLGSVTHEPEQNCPDICIKYGEGSHLWIESTYIYSKSRKVTENSTDFIRWFLNHLKEVYITYGHGVNIDIAPRNKLKAFKVPDQSRWGELVKSDSWSNLVNTLKNSNHAEIEWICPMGNATFKIRRTSRPGMVTTGPPLKEPTSPKKHTVYKEIKHKAEQAQKWSRSGNLYHPLILCIGASENTWEVDSPPSSGVSLSQAVYSALIDVRNMNLVVQANITKRIDSKSLQVPGAKYISAVIVVTLKTRTSILKPHVYRVPKASLFVNDQAAHPLTPKEIILLKKINFNRIEWGPGWESWEKPRGSKRSENTHAKRIRRQWGGASMKNCKNGAFEIELSANVVAQLLSGDISHEDLRQKYDDDLTDILKATTKQGQHIIGCEYIKANPISRKHNYIRLKYGPPKPHIISDPKKR